MKNIAVSFIFIFLYQAGCSDFQARFPDSPENATATECNMPRLEALYPFHIPTQPGQPWSTAPQCARGNYDVIGILGCPSNESGSASDCQRKRIESAMAFFEANYASTIIVSGAAVHNNYVEAETMRDLLLDEGVHEADIILEPQAEHTDENIYFISKIMEDNEWKSALIVSDEEHLWYAAVCDANCCVKKGRFSTLEFPLKDGTYKAAHYVLSPPAPAVSDAECAHIRNPVKLLCWSLPHRQTCADDFKLDVE